MFLAGATDPSATGSGTTTTKTNPAWVKAFSDAVTRIIGPILIVAATAGIIYAIWVGIKFIRAEDKSARDEAKQKLIYVIIGIVVTLALMALFYWLSSYLKAHELTDYFGYDQ